MGNNALATCTGERGGPRLTSCLGRDCAGEEGRADENRTHFKSRLMDLANKRTETVATPLGYGRGGGAAGQSRMVQHMSADMGEGEGEPRWSFAAAAPKTR